MTTAPPNPPYLGPLPHTGSAANKPIKRVVIHCTAGIEPGTPGAARSTVAFTKSHRDVISSYHYCADSRETVQAVWDSTVAYHCGTNSNSIGYELCCSLADQGRGHWERADHQAMLDRAAQDVARLCLAYDVPMTKLTVADLKAGKHGICGHVDMRDAFGNTTHWDPGPHFPWSAFVGKVRAAAHELTTPPPVEPKPPAPPHDPFTVALMPGRFDAPLEAWTRRHSEARDHGAQVVVMTEATHSGRMSGLAASLAAESWCTYHDETPGPANMMHSWDPARFEQVGEPWTVQLDTIKVWARRGTLRPQTHSVGVALRDKVTGRVVLVVGAHLPLENTERRRAAKEEALATLTDKCFDAGRAQFPHAARLLACDWNRNAKASGVRDWFAATWPRFTPSWVLTTRRAAIDWQAAGSRLAHVESTVLPRRRTDPLDHETKLTRWAWR